MYKQAKEFEIRKKVTLQLDEKKQEMKKEAAQKK